jgi:S-adenosylmethionine:tRNA ribosyltransferase-isomerase
MRLSALDYFLPEELIAQEPAPERASARLLVLDRGQAERRHQRVSDLPQILGRGDVVVLNDTRVIPARVVARRPSGGRLEILFLRPLPEDRSSAPAWEVLARGKVRQGERAFLPDGHGEWGAPLGGGRWRLHLAVREPVLSWLERCGDVPLPPYIRRPGGPTPADRERYQTTYATVPGAVAAPTAGLHFTPALLEAITATGVEILNLTLHVGPGTFLPIRVDDLDEHVMMPEHYEVPATTAARVNDARRAGRRIVAVGTTTVRALECAAVAGEVCAGAGEARLFIRPGYRFRVVDALLTNFHLPRSPLLALVTAIAGWDRIREAYEEAVRMRYRFYSFGDAMLVT